MRFQTIVSRYNYFLWLILHILLGSLDIQQVVMLKVPAKTFLSCSKRENDQKGYHQECSLRLNLVFGHFLSQVYQDDFILQILIVLNSRNELVVVSLMFCIIYQHYLCKKELKLRFLAVLMSLVGSISLIFHLMIVQNVSEL